MQERTKGRRQLHSSHHHLAQPPQPLLSLLALPSAPRAAPLLLPLCHCASTLATPGVSPTHAVWVFLRRASSLPGDPCALAYMCLPLSLTSTFSSLCPAMPSSGAVPFPGMPHLCHGLVSYDPFLQLPCPPPPPLPLRSLHGHAIVGPPLYLPLPSSALPPPPLAFLACAHVLLTTLALLHGPLSLATPCVGHYRTRSRCSHVHNA